MLKRQSELIKVQLACHSACRSEIKVRNNNFIFISIYPKSMSAGP